MNAPDAIPIFIVVSPTGNRWVEKRWQEPGENGPPQTHLLVPRSEDEVVDEAEKVLASGAAMLHYHGLDEDGKPSPDPALYQRLEQRIHALDPQAVLSFTASAKGFGVYSKDRMAGLYGSPDYIPTLSVEGGALLTKDGEDYFETLAFMYRMRRLGIEKGVRPEVEVQHRFTKDILKEMQGIGSLGDMLKRLILSQPRLDDAQRTTLSGALAEPPDLQAVLADAMTRVTLASLGIPPCTDVLRLALADTTPLLPKKTPAHFLLGISGGLPLRTDSRFDPQAFDAMFDAIMQDIRAVSPPTISVALRGEYQENGVTHMGQTDEAATKHVIRKILSGQYAGGEGQPQVLGLRVGPEENFRSRYGQTYHSAAEMVEELKDMVAECAREMGIDPRRIHYLSSAELRELQDLPPLPPRLMREATELPQCRAFENATRAGAHWESVP